MLYQLHIHPIPYQQKPNIKQVKQINNTIVDYPEVVTPEELAGYLSKGHTVLLGVMNGSRKKTNLISQQVLMLDFDNTITEKGVKYKVPEDDYVTIDDVLGSQWIQNHAAFIYKTFSYEEDWQRFRVVIFLDTILRDHETVTKTYQWLMHRFPQADPSTKDCSRIFYGGIDVVDINMANTWTPQQLENSEQPRQRTDFSNISKLTKRQASQMMRSYIKREEENLQEYGNALSAISVIAKAVLTGEIEENWAREYVKLLALGNKAWEEENELKLNDFLGKQPDDIYTNYTFKSKFSANNNADESFDVFEFTKQFVKDYEVIQYKDKIYAKNGEVWTSDDNKILRLIGNERMLKKTQDTEVFHQLEKMSVLYDGDIHTIQLSNDYKIIDGELHKGKAKEFTPYLLDVKYDPKAYNEEVDHFINFLVMDRPELRQIIIELLGHTLLLRGFPHKVFFLVGEKGGNGKSTFVEMLNNFVGDLGSNINLEAFNDSTSVAELEDKIVNIGDDIDASYLDKSMNFKTLASGNTIMVRPIYQKPRRLKNTATLIFTANDMPTFRDKSGGIERRLAIIPCDNIVEKADFGMDAKLSTDKAKSYLLNLALQGVQSIKSNGGKLSDNKVMQEELSNYMSDLDSILAFVEEEGIDENVDKKIVYQSYVDYCEAYRIKPQSANALTRRLKSLGYRIKETMRLGRKVKLYVSEEE